MALEQTVKDLQAQNAQFQEMMLSLSKGQEELKALLLEKKKDKKAVSFINPGRRRKGGRRSQVWNPEWSRRGGGE